MLAARVTCPPVSRVSSMCVCLTVRYILRLKSGIRTDADVARLHSDICRLLAAMLDRCVLNPESFSVRVSLQQWAGSFRLRVESSQTTVMIKSSTYHMIPAFDVGAFLSRYACRLITVFLPGFILVCIGSCV